MIENAGQFLALAALKRGTVEVRGEVIHVRELSVAGRAKLLELHTKQDGAGAQLLIVRNCVVQADGQPMFDDEQAKAVAEAAPEVVDAVTAEVLRLSGMEGGSKNA